MLVVVCVGSLVVCAFVVIVDVLLLVLAGFVRVEVSLVVLLCLVVVINLLLKSLDAVPSLSFIYLSRSSATCQHAIPPELL